MCLRWQTVTVGSEETEQLGKLLGKQIGGGEVVELRADLGGGKTTFVRGLARGLGSKGQVSSPSFTLMNRYKGSIPAGNIWIHHFDFYRLNEPGILADQLSESLSDKEVISVIEWSDIVQDVLPKDRITVEFKLVASNPDERRITFTLPEAKQAMMRKMETEWIKLKP